jgi:hypothetical protein
MAKADDPIAYLAIIDTAERYQREARAVRRRYQQTEALILTVFLSVIVLSVILLLVANKLTTSATWIAGVPSVLVIVAAGTAGLWQLRRSEREEVAIAERVSDYLGRYLRESSAARSVEEQLGSAWSTELRARLLGIDIGKGSVVSPKERASSPIGLDAFYGSSSSIREALRDLREAQDVDKIAIIVQGNSLTDELAEDLDFAATRDVQLSILVSRGNLPENEVMTALARRGEKVNIETRVTEEQLLGLYLVWEGRIVSGMMLVPSREGDPIAGLILDGRLNPGVSNLTTSLADYFNSSWKRAYHLSPEALDKSALYPVDSGLPQCFGR